MNNNGADSKIILSNAQLQLAADEEVILTKNAVIDGIYVLFGQLADTYVKVSGHNNLMGHPAFAIHPKISRGEKQEGLPWVMLDYPRLFRSGNGCFAVRTMFWWGRGFSLRVQLSGKYMQEAVPKLKSYSKWRQGYTVNPYHMNLLTMPWIELPAGEEDLYYIAGIMHPVTEANAIYNLYSEFFELMIKEIC